MVLRLKPLTKFEAYADKIIEIIMPRDQLDVPNVQFVVAESDLHDYNMLVADRVTDIVCASSFGLIQLFICYDAGAQCFIAIKRSYMMSQRTAA